MNEEAHLSRRERQIMDVVYASSEATVTEVVRAMADPPSRTSVRTLMRILEEKGHLTHKKRGREFIYRPVRPRQRAGQSAMRRVVKTFFGGSLEEAVAAHMADPNADLPREELERLAQLIRRARRKER